MPLKLFSIFILLVWSIAAVANENIVCHQNNVELSIKVIELAGEKNVFWTVKLQDEDAPVYSGFGIFQKEAESEDAFSSYDELTAISYKNNKAIFVLPDNNAIFFSDCQK